MAEYEDLEKLIAQFMSQGRTPEDVERGKIHPQDPRYQHGLEGAQISPAQEKIPFADLMTGSLHGDVHPRVTTAIAEMAGLPEEYARTLGASTDLIEQLGEAGIAVGRGRGPSRQAPASRAKPEPRGSMYYQRMQQRRPRGARGLNPRDFDLQTRLETLRGTPEGEALAESLRQAMGQEGGPLGEQPRGPATLDEILRMFPDVTVETIEEGAGNLPINASLESGAGGSVEALRRTQDMARQGRRFVRIGPGGQRVPSTEDGGINLPKGWKFGVEGPDGLQILDQ